MENLATPRTSWVIVRSRTIAVMANTGPALVAPNPNVYTVPSRIPRVPGQNPSAVMSIYEMFGRVTIVPPFTALDTSSISFCNLIDHDVNGSLAPATEINPVFPGKTGIRGSRRRCRC